MEAQFGFNLVTWLVFFPVLLLGMAVIIWFIIKMKVTRSQRIGIAVVGAFAFFGFFFVSLMVYYHTNTTFAQSFKFYGYAALAPDSSPFSKPDGYTGRVLMTREVLKQGNQITLLNHPNPTSPTEVAVFAHGKYIQAQLMDTKLSVPKDTPGSLPRVVNISLFWALTKSLLRINAS